MSDTPQGYAHLLEEIDELKKENAALREDAERLDWLDKTGAKEGHAFCGIGYGYYRYYAHAGKKWPTARATIDAARKS